MGIALQSNKPLRVRFTEGMEKRFFDNFLIAIRKLLGSRAETRPLNSN